MSFKKTASEKKAAAAQKAAEQKVLDAGKRASQEIGELATRLQRRTEASAAALAAGVATAAPKVQESLGRAQELSGSAKQRATAATAPVAAKAADRAAEGRAAIQEKYAGAAAMLAGRFADADTPEQLEAVVAKLTGDKKAVANAKKAAAKAAKDYAKQQKKAQGSSHKGLLLLGLVVAGGLAGVAAWKASRPVEDPWKTPAATSPRVTASPVAGETTVAAGTGVQVDQLDDVKVVDVKETTTTAPSASEAATEVKDNAKSIGDDAKVTIHEVKEQIQGRKDDQA